MLINTRSPRYGSTVRVEFNRRDNVALIELADDVDAGAEGGTTYTVGHPHARGMIDLSSTRSAA